MTVFRFFLLLFLAGAAVLAWGYRNAVSTPIVRRAQIALPDWPAGAKPVTLLLVSDIHVAGPDMPPERLARIVGQINALAPDMVAIAGDFVSDRRLSTRHYSAAEAVAPLAALRAPLGRIGVLGNHDHWRDARAMRDALGKAGVTMLANDAVRRGPLAIGGLDDAFTDHADLPETVRKLSALGGAKILLSHSPDPFAELPAGIGLMLAGHTHCGQIVLPLVGPIATASDFGARYLCGIVREKKRVLIVGAGVGTSLLPLRYGTRPELWLVEVRGPEKVSAGRRPRPGAAPRSPRRSPPAGKARRSLP